MSNNGIFKSIFLSGLILSSIISCQNRPKKTDIENRSVPVTKEQLYQVNQMMVRQEAAKIKAEAQKRNWNLTETPTGLFYQKLAPSQIHPSSETKIQAGMHVVLDYSMSLLDGTLCYSSKDQGYKQFVVEKSEAERGLHEAVQLFHPGDSIMLVVPPHMGFGLMGDGNRVPSRAILVYHIKILSAD